MHKIRKQSDNYVFKEQVAVKVLKRRSTIASLIQLSFSPKEEKRRMLKRSTRWNLLAADIQEQVAKISVENDMQLQRLAWERGATCLPTKHKTRSSDKALHRNVRTSEHRSVARIHIPRKVGGRPMAPGSALMGVKVKLMDKRSPSSRMLDREIIKMARVQEEQERRKQKEQNQQKEEEEKERKVRHSRQSGIARQIDIFGSYRRASLMTRPSLSSPVPEPIEKFRRVVRLLSFLQKMKSSTDRKHRGHQQQHSNTATVLEQLQDEAQAGLEINEEMVFDPNNFKAVKEVQLSQEAVHILSLCPDTRSDEELQTALTALKASVAAFGEYPLKMQKRLVSVGWYERFEAKRVIIRQGHRAENFYFMLSGTAIVTLLDDDNSGEQRNNTIAVLTKGSSFGELALLHHKTRSATVLCKDEVSLLAVGREDFRNIFMSYEDGKEPEHIRFLKTVPYLKDLPLDDLVTKHDVCIFHYFRRGVVIVKGGKTDWIYIVKTALTALKASVAAFGEYPLKMQKRLVSVGWYERFEAKRVIIRQGHRAENFYFMLSGTAIVTLLDDDNSGEQRNNTIAVLTKGSSFGELALLHHKTRSATVLCKDEVSLLAVGREDFRNIFMSYEDGKEPEHIRFLKTVPYLKDLPLDDLVTKHDVCIFHYFRRGVVIVKGGKTDWIYIVKTALTALKASVAAFGEYPLKMQKRLVSVGWYERFEAKRVIIRQGHRAENFYFMLSGTAIVTLLDDDNSGEQRNNTIAVLTKGSSFGELALLHHKTRSATVLCKDEVSLLAVGREGSCRVLTHLVKKKVKLTRPAVRTPREQAAYLPVISVNEPDSGRALFTVAGHRERPIVVTPTMSKRPRTEPSKRRNKDLSLPAIIANPDKFKKTVKNVAIPWLMRLSTAEVKAADAEEHRRKIEALHKRVSGLDATKSPMKQNDTEHVSEDDPRNERVVVQIELLKPKDQFGMSSVVFDKSCAQCHLVSNGAECVLIKKSWLLQYASESTMRMLRRQIPPYPSQETLEQKMQDQANWDSYKTQTVSQLLDTLHL